MAHPSMSPRSSGLGGADTGASVTRAARRRAAARRFNTNNGGPRANSAASGGRVSRKNGYGVGRRVAATTGQVRKSAAAREESGISSRPAYDNTQSQTQSRRKKRPEPAPWLGRRLTRRRGRRRSGVTRRIAASP